VQSFSGYKTEDSMQQNIEKAEDIPELLVLPKKQSV
jgi:hypothetical protein